MTARAASDARRRRRNGWLQRALCLALLAGLPSAVLAGEAATGTTPANASASPGEHCRPHRDLRCWYLVGAVGQAPRRLALIASNAGALEAGRRRVEFIQVIEQADYPHRFTIRQLEVDCNAGRFRILGDRVGHPDGMVTDAAIENDQWQAFSAGRFGEGSVQPLACNPGQPGADTALFLGNAYRAPDVIQHFRRSVLAR